MFNLLIVVAAIGLGMIVGWFGWLVGLAIVGLLLVWFLLARPFRLVGLLLVLLVLGQFGRIPPGSANGALLLTDLVAALIFMLWILWMLARAPKPSQSSHPRSPVLIVWTGFLVVALCALVLTPLTLAKRDLAVDASYWLRLFWYSSLIWIVPVLMPGKTDALRLFKWIVASCVGVMIIGFVQLYLLPNIGPLAVYGWDPHVGRLVSSFLDPNYLGGFFAISIAVLFAAFSFATSKAQAFGLGVALALTLAAAVMTFSRSGYLAVGIVVLILGLRYSWKLLLLGIICILPLALSIPRVEQRVAGGFAVDKTAQDRIQSWLIASDIIRQYPLTGIGYNAYRGAQEQLEGKAVGATSRSGAGSDSSLLNVFATTGVLGLGLFLATIALLLRQAYRVVTEAGSAKPTPQSAAALVLLVSAPALFVHSWFVNGLFYPFILLLICLLLALLHMPGTSKGPG